MITINHLELANDFEQLFFLGDIHGNWNRIIQFLKEFELTNCIIFQLGDFNVGYRRFEKEFRALDTINNFLKKKGSTLIVIRGNHDDPSFFEKDKFNLSHILFVPDYSIVSFSWNEKIKKVFCLGGAISVDRKDEDRKVGVNWFEGEGVNATSDMSILNQIKELDVIISHNAPDFVPPFVLGPLVAKYALNDPYLIMDLMQERQSLSNMMGYILKSNPTCKHYFYGHYHRNEISWYRDVRFECLAIEQFKVLEFL